MAYQDEIEEQLASCFSEIDPEIIGNEYIVFGTIEKKIWKIGLKEGYNRLNEVLKHTADFEDVLKFEIETDGWYPAHKE